MTNKKPILVIDARPLARGSGGIQRYVQKLLPHLIATSHYKIILYSDRPIVDMELSKNVNVRFIGRNILTNLLWYIKVPLWLKKDKVNIFWSPRHHLPLLVPKGCKKIVTIHDFVWKTCPTTMPKLQLASEMILMPLSLKNTTRIICISKSTHSQLKHFFRDHANKSTVILHLSLIHI